MSGCIFSFSKYRQDTSSFHAHSLKAAKHGQDDNWIRCSTWEDSSPTGGIEPSYPSCLWPGVWARYHDTGFDCLGPLPTGGLVVYRAIAKSILIYMRFSVKALCTVLSYSHMHTVFLELKYFFSIQHTVFLDFSHRQNNPELIQFNSWCMRKKMRVTRYEIIDCQCSVIFFWRCSSMMFR